MADDLQGTLQRPRDSVLARADWFHVFADWMARGEQAPRGTAPQIVAMVEASYAAAEQRSLQWRFDNYVANFSLVVDACWKQPQNQPLIQALDGMIGVLARMAPGLEEALRQVPFRLRDRQEPAAIMLAIAGTVRQAAGADPAALADYCAVLADTPRLREDTRLLLTPLGRTYFRPMVFNDFLDSPRSDWERVKVVAELLPHVDEPEGAAEVALRAVVSGFEADVATAVVAALDRRQVGDPLQPVMSAMENAFRQKARTGGQEVQPAQRDRATAGIGQRADLPGRGTAGGALAEGPARS